MTEEIVENREGESQERPSIYTRLQAVMLEVDAVEKRGYNESQKYKYVRAADVAREVRAALLKHGVGFSYTVKDIERWEKIKDGNVSQFGCQVTVLVTFTDLETSESMTIESVGWGFDPLDKAPYKAFTGALKYALRMNFLIPDELDPENSDHEIPEPESRPQVRAISRPDGVFFDPNEFENENFSTKDAPVAQRSEQSTHNAKAVGSIPTGSTKEFCPECDKPLKLRKGKNGDFWGCTGYPGCRFTKKAG